MKDNDVESQEEESLLALTGSKVRTVPEEGEIMHNTPKADMKEAALWLSLLFIASIVMTVGNKVRLMLPQVKDQLGTFVMAGSPDYASFS